MTAEVTREKAIEYLQELLVGSTQDFERILLVIANKQVLECQLVFGSQGYFIRMEDRIEDDNHWKVGEIGLIGESIDDFVTVVRATLAQYFLVHTPMNVYEEEEVRKVLRKRKSYSVAG